MEQRKRRQDMRDTCTWEKQKQRKEERSAALRLHRRRSHRHPALHRGKDLRKDEQAKNERASPLELVFLLFHRGAYLRVLLNRYRLAESKLMRRDALS